MLQKTVLQTRWSLNEPVAVVAYGLHKRYGLTSAPSTIEGTAMQDPGDIWRHFVHRGLPQVGVPIHEFA